VSVSKTLERLQLLPPLPEQHKIVEILEDYLSRLDAALANVKQAKIKAVQFRRSLLQAAFTGNLGSDRTRIMTDLPNGWETRTLRDWEMDAQSGFASGAHNSENKGVIHLRPMNISRLGKLDFDTVKSVEDDSARRIVKGDILFNNTNSAELVGKTTLIDVDGDFAYSNHMTRLRFPVERVDHKYMSTFLHSMWMSGFFNEICSNHVNQASVSIKRLEQVEIPLPPLPEQHKIVEILDDHLSSLDASIALADAMEKQSAGLRRSLLQAAFTGQLTKEVAIV
jgi:type I restriction enzyme S subunit